MNISSFSENSSSRPTSFFIEDILLNKPKTMCRAEINHGLFRPGIPEYGFQCIPGTHLLYPHQVLQAQNFLHKHSDHPFLIPTAGELFFFFLNIVIFNVPFYNFFVIYCDLFLFHTEISKPTFWGLGWGGVLILK